MLSSFDSFDSSDSSDESCFFAVVVLGEGVVETVVEADVLS